MLTNPEQAQIQRSIRAILGNADRLAEDARSLWEMDRFPSAFALCILAQEEYGKAFLLHFVSVEAMPWNDDVQRVLRDHTSKQLLA
jgi:AbiV family abortive infection protein